MARPDVAATIGAALARGHLLVVAPEAGRLARGAPRTVHAWLELQRRVLAGSAV